MEKRRGSAIYRVGLVQLSGLYTNAKSRYKYPQPPSSPGNLDFLFFFFLPFPYLHASLRASLANMEIHTANASNRHNFNSTHQMKSHHATGGTGETRVPFMITLEAIMLGLAITATILRTRLRRRSMGRLRVEDWCCIGATVRALLVGIKRPICLLNICGNSSF